MKMEHSASPQCSYRKKHVHKNEINNAVESDTTLWKNNVIKGKYTNEQVITCKNRYRNTDILFNNVETEFDETLTWRLT